MKIEHKQIDDEKKIIRITTSDERWYAVPQKEGIVYIPSVTWICEYYPKGIGFYRWLADKGWNEAEAIKEAAGDKGSAVHNAVSALLSGEVIRHNATFTDAETGKEREITVDEYEAVMSFSDWWKTLKNPKILAYDETVFGADNKYAGTLDLRLEIDSEKWLIDLKTSSQIWPSHELQVSAYKHSGYEDHKIGILQLGYKRNKNKYKFTEIEDQFGLFIDAALPIWAKETKGVKPLQRDFPLKLTLNRSGE